MNKNPNDFLERAKMVMHKTDAQLGSPVKQSNDTGVVNDVKQFYEQTEYPTERKLTESSKKLPGSIYEAMMKTPLTQEGNISGLSVLDQFMPQQIPTNNQDNIFRFPQEITNIPEDQYGEKTMPTTAELFSKLKQKVPTQQNQSNQPIDYTIIKMFIDNSINENFKKLEEKILNNFIIKLGKDVQIIDSSGNIFKGSLKKIGNINNK